MIKTQEIYDPIYTNRDKFVILLTGGRGCFHGDTLVMTDKGSIKIKDINPDTKVLSFNESKKSNEYNSVAKLFVYEIDEEVIKVNLKNGRTIIATKDHKFYYRGRWISLLDLVHLSDGRNLEKNTQLQKIRSKQFWECENFKLEELRKNGSNETLEIEIGLSSDSDDKRPRGKEEYKSSSNGLFSVSRSAESQLNCESYKSYKNRQSTRKLGMVDAFRECDGRNERRFIRYAEGRTNRKLKIDRKRSQRNKGKVYSKDLFSGDVGERVWCENLHNKRYNQPSQLELADVESYKFINNVKKVYDISVVDNHNYYLDCDKPVLVHNSAKSFNATTFIERLTFEEGHKILFSRYTLTSAEISIIPEFTEKIELEGTQRFFKTTKKDIVNLRTGSQILFRGIKTSSGNQTANLKSINGITTFVGDEMEEWRSEDDYDKLILSIRKKGIQNRVLLILNPCDADHFIYRKYIENTHKIVEIDGVDVQISTHPNVLHIHSTYFDNQENVNEQFLAEIAEIKEQSIRAATDEQGKFSKSEFQKTKYSTKIIGRWADIADGVIFTNVSVGEFDESLPYLYGQDYGFSVDPDTLIKVAVNNRTKKIYLDERYYSHKSLSTDQLAEMNKTYIERQNDLIVGDSAEPRLISDLGDRGLNIEGTQKIAGIVSASILEMLGYEIIVTENSLNLLREFRNYVWNDKKAGIPMDNYNHGIDAARYGFIKLTNFVSNDLKSISGLI